MSLLQDSSVVGSDPAPRGHREAQALTLLLLHHLPDVASSHSPQQLTTTSTFQLGSGWLSPYLWGTTSKMYMPLLPSHLIGQNMFTWFPQLQDRKGKWALGVSLQSATPGQGMGFPKNDLRNARRKRGPPHTQFPWPKNCEK